MVLCANDYTVNVWAFEHFPEIIVAFCEVAAVFLVKDAYRTLAMSGIGITDGEKTNILIIAKPVHYTCPSAADTDHRKIHTVAGGVFT
jgi:hypothetical protein